MFHINPESGNPGKCTAQDGNCPFGDSAPHYGSADAARTAFEASMARHPSSLGKTKATTTATLREEISGSFFRPQNGFDKADMQAMLRDPRYTDLRAARYSEIVEEFQAEVAALNATAEGRAELEAREEKERQKHAGRHEDAFFNGRGRTYHYVSKSGAVRTTHTGGSAAIPHHNGFATTWLAQAHRDVLVKELQQHGFTKKRALEHLFAYSSGVLK